MGGGGSLEEKKKDLFIFVFLHFFQLPDKCHNICVAFLKNKFVEFTGYVGKRVTIAQGKC